MYRNKPWLSEDIDCKKIASSSRKLSLLRSCRIAPVDLSRTVASSETTRTSVENEGVCPARLAAHNGKIDHLHDGLRGAPAAWVRFR